VGNATGIAVALCIIATRCFLQDRFLRAGTLCFALSLLLKPHVTGPILLYFLLTKGENRKHALRTIAVTSVLGLLAALWMYCVAPHWSSELHANLQETTARSGVNDPGPTGLDPRAHGAVLISLQTVLSLVKNDPHFYNSAAYLVCAPVLIIWAVTAIRRHDSKGNAWLGIATIAVLSMLPLYHRQHDTRLLMLLIPAVTMLWANGGFTAKVALWLTAACAFLTGDVTGQFLAIAADRMHLSAHGFAGELLNLGMTRPAPLALFVVGAFYLWVYVRTASGLQAPVVSGRSKQDLPASESAGPTLVRIS